MAQDLVKINQCVLRLIFDRPLKRLVGAGKLRGAIASLNKDNILFHQHANNRRLFYKYPLIQYKIINNKGIVLGLGEGAVAVGKVILLRKRLHIAKDKYIVQKQEMSFSLPSIGSLGRRIKYKFLTPWLALNKKNYQKYHMLGNQAERTKMLEKILAGNIISMSKGLGFTVFALIEANIHEFTEIQTYLKGTPMLGFLCTFSVNFAIPAYWGIGKSVSRGFGVVKRVEN